MIENKGSPFRMAGIAGTEDRLLFNGAVCDLLVPGLLLDETGGSAGLVDIGWIRGMKD